MGSVESRKTLDFAVQTHDHENSVPLSPLVMIMIMCTHGCSGFRGTLLPFMIMKNHMKGGIFVMLALRLEAGWGLPIV